MANVSTGPGFNPALLVDPDIQTQQAQIQRQYALAQALREQGMQDTPGNGGSISWTQGLARLADAWASRKLNQKADAQQSDVGRRYAGAMRGMFGMGQPEGGDPTAATAQPPRTIDLPGEGQVPLGQAAPTQAPTAAPEGQQPQGRGPWSLTGNPGQDMAAYTMNPEEYGKAMIGNMAKGSGPTDREIALNHAQQALARGDIATATALLQGVQKDNYIAPITGRPGSTLRDPVHPEKVIGYDAPNIEGAFPQYGENGMPTGYATAPGAAEAVGGIEGAKAGAKAAFEPITGYDESGKPVFTNKAAATQGGAAHGGGPLQNTFGGAGGSLSPAPRPGFTEAAGVRGKASGERFDGLTQSGMGSQERLYQLSQIDRLNSESRFGPGSHTWASLNGYVNTALGKDVLDPKGANNVAEFSKYATQLAANQAQALGLNGTDAKFGAIMKAVPNPDLQNGAVKELTKYFRRNEYAIQMRANAATKWVQQHGADTSDQFEQSWRGAFNRSNPLDSEMFAWVQHGPEGFQRAVKSLPADQRGYVINRYKQLRGLGAFGQ
jgi:hypothetical protein